MSTVNGKKEKVFGLDLDPTDRLSMTTDEEGYPTCKLDNKPCSTEDYLELQKDNATRHSLGKPSRTFGFFTGLNFDKNGNVIKSNS